jgi:penicillin-binding protein 1A
MITDVLREALVRGTGSTARAGFSGPAAGKTGTTNDGADAWFVGYTPDVVATVWMGFDEVQPILGGATGGRLAAPIWGKVMRRLYRQRSVPKAWAAPSDVVDVQIDEMTGFALSFDCVAPQETTRREIFRRGATPMTACPVPDGEATLEPAVWRPVSGVQPEPADSVDGEAEEPVRSYAPKAESSSDP